MFIFERERECKSGRGRERGRHRSKAGSRLQAVSTEPDVGLELTSREIMTWAKVGHLTDWAIQVPPAKVLILQPMFSELWTYMPFCICVSISMRRFPSQRLLVLPPSFIEICQFLRSNRYCCIFLQKFVWIYSPSRVWVPISPHPGQDWKLRTVFDFC